MSRRFFGNVRVNSTALRIMEGVIDEICGLSQLDEFDVLHV
jgi:hypothetical protein